MVERANAKVQKSKHEIVNLRMAIGKLFIGLKVRELRVAHKATQAQFAERLGISTSYLNQIETNQRPVSATVLIALVDKFHLDFTELGAGESDRLLSALSEALSDPLFEAYSPGVQELKLITQNAPGIAHALIAAHQAYRRKSEQLASIDQDVAKGFAEVSPYEEVRDFFHFVDNYVHELDLAAERLAERLVLSNDRRGALVRYLKDEHDITTEFVHEEAALRRFQPESRTLTINSYASHPTQRFHLAVQIAQLDASSPIDAIITNAGFRTAEAMEICRIGLHNYFAGALLMPYGAFIQAAREARHDVDLLALGFESSVEQVCHRLSTLQRPGNKGVPVFFARIDRAGNITKRHSSTKLQFARFGAACPLWNAHQAFDAHGRIIRQLAEMPDGTRYLSLATQVVKAVGGYKSIQTSYVLAFGCEVSYADSFVYADDLDVSESSKFDPIGVSCRICDRAKCPSRAVPPLKRKITVDHLHRLALPYQLT